MPQPMALAFSTKLVRSDMDNEVCQKNNAEQQGQDAQNTVSLAAQN